MKAFLQRLASFIVSHQNKFFMLIGLFAYFGLQVYVWLYPEVCKSPMPGTIGYIIQSLKSLGT